MSPSQYKAALKTLKLTQEGAGDFLGIHPRTSQGYALGEYPVPKAIAMLLRTMVKYGLTTDDVK